MLKLIDTVTIAEHWICAIEYGDYSGLDDTEAEDLDAWLEQYPSCTFSYGESSEFDGCDISGLMATCIEVEIYQEV